MKLDIYPASVLPFSKTFQYKMLVNNDSSLFLVQWTRQLTISKR